MARCLFVPMLLTTAIFANCSRGDTTPPSDAKPTAKKMTYPYKMRAADRKAFLDNAKTLRRGKTYAEVVKLLGPPDSQYGISAMERDRPLGTRVTYYLKKLGDGVNVGYDQSVSLDFDNGNKLTGVLLQNLPDLCKALTDVPVTATRWNDLTKEIESVVKQGERRGDNNSLKRSP